MSGSSVKKAAVKKAARKPAARKPSKKAASSRSVEVSESGVRRSGTELLRGTNLAELSSLINSLPGVVTSVTDGIIEGDAGWLVTWERDS